MIGTLHTEATHNKKTVVLLIVAFDTNSCLIVLFNTVPAKNGGSKIKYAIVMP